MMVYVNFITEFINAINGFFHWPPIRRINSISVLAALAIQLSRSAAVLPNGRHDK